MPADPVRGRRWADHRRTLEAIVWKYRTGSPWRDLPDELGSFQTAYKRLLRWASDGTWERILSAFLQRPTRLLTSAGPCQWTPLSARHISTPPEPGPGHRSAGPHNLEPTFSVQRGSMRQWSFDTPTATTRSPRCTPFPMTPGIWNWMRGRATAPLSGLVPAHHPSHARPCLPTVRSACRPAWPGPVSRQATADRGLPCLGRGAGRTAAR